MNACPNHPTVDQRTPPFHLYILIVDHIRGVFYWKGVQKGGEREIRSPLKPQWRQLTAEEVGATAATTTTAAPAAIPKKAAAALASA